MRCSGGSWGASCSMRCLKRLKRSRLRRLESFCRLTQHTRSSSWIDPRRASPLIPGSSRCSSSPCTHRRTRYSQCDRACSTASMSSAKLNSRVKTTETKGSNSSSSMQTHSCSSRSDRLTLRLPSSSRSRLILLSARKASNFYLCVRSRAYSSICRTSTSSSLLVSGQEAKRVALETQTYLEAGGSLLEAGGSARSLAGAGVLQMGQGSFGFTLASLLISFMKRFLKVSISKAGLESCAALVSSLGSRGMVYWLVWGRVRVVVEVGASRAASLSFSLKLLAKSLLLRSPKKPSPTLLSEKSRSFWKSEVNFSFLCVGCPVRGVRLGMFSRKVVGVVGAGADVLGVRLWERRALIFSLTESSSLTLSLNWLALASADSRGLRLVRSSARVTGSTLGAVAAFYPLGGSCGRGRLSLFCAACLVWILRRISSIRDKYSVLSLHSINSSFIINFYPPNLELALQILIVKIIARIQPTPKQTWFQEEKDRGYSVETCESRLIDSFGAIFNLKLGSVFGCELRYNLTMLGRFNKLAFFFARTIRRLPRGQSQAQMQESSSPPPSEVVSQEGQERDLEEELAEELEPLSYDRQVQDSLRRKVAEQLRFSYEGEDPNPHKLVHRPSKGAAWGLGGQLMLASRKVQLEGLKAETDAIVEFLQLHQCKNIYVHDFFAENAERRENNRRRYAILASCFSSKHCWKTGIELKNAFNLNSAKTKLKRRQEYDPVFAVMNGGKAEEWTLVEYKEYEVSLMTEEQREAMDLEWKWNNPVAEEVLDKHIEMKIMKKGRKRQFEDMD